VKKTVTISDTSFNVEVKRAKDTITVILDGKAYDFNCNALNQGWVLSHNEDVFHTHMMGKHNDKHRILINAQALEMQIKDPYAFEDQDLSGAVSGHVKAVMPGRLVKIFVAEGQAVAMGDPILVLEAMKMENEIKAPCQGKVEKIFVAEGTSVESGATLLSIV